MTSPVRATTAHRSALIMRLNGRDTAIGIALFLITACQGLGGSHLPTMTRTGDVKDVIIQQELTPSTLTVKPGDEIRWVNKRQGAADVVFMDPVMDRLTCERNFGRLMKRADRQHYTARLNTQESASVCFGGPGEIQYEVRSESPAEGGLTLPGTIQVSPGGS